MRKQYFLWSCLTIIVISLGMACRNTDESQVLYTCPMPQDSVFSKHPGTCPKCGMKLVPVTNRDQAPADHQPARAKVLGYTCPMHPQVHRDSSGVCPVCGMTLEKEKPEGAARSVSLNTLLKPVNSEVVANIPMVHLLKRTENLELPCFGFVEYDTRQAGTISANVSGRIEKLYVGYRYQQIQKGQKIMDIYSPELVTAQENLLFIMKNDPENEILLRSARQKLLLLGMSERQVKMIAASGKPDYRTTIFSGYSGHIHESTVDMNTGRDAEGAVPASSSLSVKEGTYVQKGQPVFSVYDPSRAWVLLSLFPGQASMIKKGDSVRIIPEAGNGNAFNAIINYVEPLYRDNNKTLTARVYFNNGRRQLAIGSQVKATVYAGHRSASWLPEEAVISLGLDVVVFVRSGEAFKARKIETGITQNHLIQVLNGLDQSEAVAANAQYLVDSESFIQVQ